jgi:predicted methyltransferase MtxX (methanogen marker protein 4)
MKLQNLKIDMKTEILKALSAKYKAELEVITINMDNYLLNPVGVAEHPDIVSEVDKLIEQAAAIEEKLKLVNDMLMFSGN